MGPPARSKHCRAQKAKRDQKWTDSTWNHRKPTSDLFNVTFTYCLDSSIPTRGTDSMVLQQRSPYAPSSTLQNGLFNALCYTQHSRGATVSAISTCLLHSLTDSLEALLRLQESAKQLQWVFRLRIYIDNRSLQPPRGDPNSSGKSGLGASKTLQGRWVKRPIARSPRRGQRVALHDLASAIMVKNLVRGGSQTSARKHK